ncbi:MAG TPA: GNAT family N-acetyltransferase [Sphingomonas sp.]|uniref:GNAT family N-acetyltransferase n=1 Tax=Sphingomonas sp. TaxID=28214 RepID=UPI002C04F203|nr:GNAT family N-acetyltransferase [Sphingomonas sp.]HMI18624.1 GNAT family N-acetyltransferase [Sphingomonas sp.]
MTRQISLRIRKARPDDADAIAAIYRHHVLHGTGTFEEEPPSVGDMAGRLEKVQAHGWPWLVAEADSAVAGYAYAAQFRDRAAYRFACENSIYVHPDHIGAGVGRALLDALLPASAEAGFQRMFAVIGDSGNLGSIRLHERADFTHCGQLDKAGFKFGRYLDVVFMQREI